MNNLKLLLKEKDMTQLELSKKTGYNKDYINRAINGYCKSVEDGEKFVNKFWEELN